MIEADENMQTRGMVLADLTTSAEDSEPALLSATEAATLIGVGIWEVYRLVKARRIPRANPGSYPMLLSREAVLAYGSRRRFLLDGPPTSRERRVARIIQALEVAFPWDQTEDGFAYWDDVRSRLMRMITRAGK